MDFSTPLNGESFFSRVLASTPPDQQHQLLKLVNWYAPDSTVLPVPMDYQRWGIEVVFAHPLATIASSRNESLFRQALEEAHAAQPKSVYLKSERDHLDMSDWVQIGVLGATARFGTTTMLSDLLNKLKERKDLTRSIIYHEGRRAGFLCPYEGLAKSKQDGEYAQKLKILVRNAINNTQQEWGVNLSPGRMNKLGRDTREKMYTHVLNCALRVGNSNLIDAVASLGTGPLGHAKLTSDGVYSALVGRQFQAVDHVLSLVNWDTSFLNRSEPKASATIVRATANQAPVCLRQIHPEKTIGWPEIDNFDYYKTDNPIAEQAAIARLAGTALDVIADFSDEKLKKIEAGGFTLESYKHPSIHPIFLGLHVSDVEPKWQILEKIQSNHVLNILPNADGWTMMSCFHNNPWVQRVQRALGELDKEQFEAFISMQAKGLIEIWNKAIETDDEDRIKMSIRGAQSWWTSLPEPRRPKIDVLAWLSETSKRLPDDKTVLIRKSLLEIKAAQSVEVKGPSTSTSTRPPRI